MAVLSRHRKIAVKTEYENTFRDLYQYTIDQTTAVPIRRKRWLCWKIDADMNHIFSDIMEVSTGYYAREIQNEQREVVVERAIHSLFDLEQPLMVLWNVQKYPTNKMVQWCDLINKETKLLNGLLNNKLDLYEILVLDWEKIKSMKFMNNMLLLHRYIHGKVVKAPNKYDDNNASLLIDLVDEAMYQLVKANENIPKSKAEYDKRQKRISKSISCLHKMKRPILLYFNVVNYSENTLYKWSEMLNEEIKLLYALNRSDKNRFKELP